MRIGPYEIELSISMVLHPVAVRYGYANVPDAYLENNTSLPFFPFRRDFNVMYSIVSGPSRTNILLYNGATYEGDALANSSDNWMLIDVDNGSSGNFFEYDTAVQINTANHTIVNVWHDTLPINENVVLGVTRFSDITPSEVAVAPEPSTVILLGSGILSLAVNRRRIKN